jgi:hypothetical protein
MIKFTRSIKYLFVIFSISLIGYLILANYAPFGITKRYTSIDGAKITELGPKNRVEKSTLNSDVVYHQFDDLIYFSTSMPFKFDTATVKITYKNQSPDQLLYLGYQDQDTWHYDLKLIDDPSFRDLNWPKVGVSPYLYQKLSDYSSIDQFLNNPPKDKVIGLIHYDKGFSDLSNIKLSNYQKKNQTTLIQTPLRGKQIIYTYLENEPFVLDFEYYDLNQYPEPDNFDVNIYKNQQLVFQHSNIDTQSDQTVGNVSPKRSVHIQNPGPELPENGVYKIVIDAPIDIVIVNIKTNLHKLVFQGPLNPIENNEIFPRIVSATKPTTLFTNALTLTAKTYHEQALQEIKVASDSAVIDLKVQTKSKAKQSYPTLSLKEINHEESIILPLPLTQIFIPLSDVIIDGNLGYFAFSKDQFFVPTSGYIVQVTDPSDLQAVDYVLTNYSPPKLDGEWLVSDTHFNLSDATIQNGKLSWLIKAPQLKDSNHQILIKNIEVILTKKPSIDLRRLLWK